MALITADLAAVASAASSNSTTLFLVQGDVGAQADVASLAILAIFPNGISAFSIGGDPTLYPVLVSVVNPLGEQFDSISPQTALYILGLADTTDVVVVADVVIPSLLDLVTDLDPYRFSTYWLLRNYFALPEVREALEPIRAKVASTQDLSLLTEEDRRVALTLYNLHSTDVENYSVSQTLAAL